MDRGNQRTFIGAALVAAAIAILAWLGSQRHQTEQRAPDAPTAASTPTVPAAREPSVSTCARPPLNGTVLSAFVGQRGRHTLRIGNQTGGNMIVKTRADLTGHVVASFFVAPNMEASLEGLPDGAYRIQYVLGTKLAEDCRSFIHHMLSRNCLACKC